MNSASRFSMSGTLRSIYVIRFLLFSMGLAAGVAVVQRMAFQSEHPWAGLLLGLVAGAALFRGQLRALRYPTLQLSQQALYLRKRGETVTVPWTQVEAVFSQQGNVCIRQREGRELLLNPKEFSTSAGILGHRLETLHSEPELRAQLPTDVSVRKELAL